MSLKHFNIRLLLWIVIIIRYISLLPLYSHRSHNFIRFKAMVILWISESIVYIRKYMLSHESQSFASDNKWRSLPENMKSISISVYKLILLYTSSWHPQSKLIFVRLILVSRVRNRIFHFLVFELSNFMSKWFRASENDNYHNISVIIY